MSHIMAGDDVLALARKLAAAFAAGRMEEADAHSLAATFPFATFSSILLCGSPTLMVATGNLLINGFITQSLLPVERCRCVQTAQPVLLPSDRCVGVVPTAGRRLAPLFLCIPVPPLPPQYRPGVPPPPLQHPPAAIGAFILGLNADYSKDAALSVNAANLTRALQIALPGAAIEHARGIASTVSPAAGAGLQLGFGAAGSQPQPAGKFVPGFGASGYHNHGASGSQQRGDSRQHGGFGGASGPGNHQHFASFPGMASELAAQHLAAVEEGDGDPEDDAPGATDRTAALLHDWPARPAGR